MRRELSAGGKYKMAARKFVEVEPELQYAHTLPCAEWSKHVLLPRDVALLGGLCALAAFDRDELRQHVIDVRRALVASRTQVQDCMA